MRLPGDQIGDAVVTSGSSLLFSGRNGAHAMTLAGEMIAAHRSFVASADPATGDVLWARSLDWPAFGLQADGAGGAFARVGSRDILRVDPVGSISHLLTVGTTHRITAFTVRGDLLIVATEQSSITNFIWAYSLAGPEPEELWRRIIRGNATDVFGLAVDSTNRVYVTGVHTTPISVGDLMADASSPEGFLLALDSDGAPRWLRDYDGEVTLDRVTTDSSDHVWTTGAFTGQVNFGNGMVDAGSRFIGVALRYSADNVYSRDIHFVQPATTTNVVTAITIDHADGVILGGSFTGMVDFLGTGTKTSAGTFGGDAFIVRVP